MFHIIDDWYLVAGNCCWMIAQLVGEKKAGTGHVSPAWKNQKYYRTLESALTSFTEEFTREKAHGYRTDGELSDLLAFLSTEYKRLEDGLKLALLWAKGKQADAAHQNP